MKRTYLAVSLLVLLTACDTPTSVRPQLSPIPESDVARAAAALGLNGSADLARATEMHGRVFAAWDRLTPAAQAELVGEAEAALTRALQEDTVLLEDLHARARALEARLPTAPAPR